MLYAIVAVIALIIDQLVKYWTTVRIVVDTGEAKLIPGLVHMANVHNTGAAFSFLEGARWFFVILCILFVLVVIYILLKDIISTPVARWMAVIVMAGAVGNCIDRIVCGYVVDMFEFEFIRFPVFNVADIYITLGAIIFCLCVLLEKPKAATPKAIPAEAEETESTAEKTETRRHKKTETTDFSKPEQIGLPTANAEDPFAKWEKHANAPEVKPDKPASGTVIYTQPTAQKPASTPPVAKPNHAPAAPEAPAAQPQTPPKAEPPQAATETYNLDDILAEFRDQ